MLPLHSFAFRDLGLCLLRLLDPTCQCLEADLNKWKTHHQLYLHHALWASAMTLTIMPGFEDFSQLSSASYDHIFFDNLDPLEF